MQSPIRFPLLITGANDYAAREYLQKISAEFSNSESPSVITPVDLEEVEITDLPLYFHASSLFGSSQLIVVKHVFDAKLAAKREVLVELLSHENLNCVVIFSPGTADKRQSLYRMIEKVGSIAEFLPLKQYDLTSFVDRYCKSEGSSISAQATQLLLEQLGAVDLQTIVQALDKLLCYCADLQIDVEHVRDLVQTEPVDDVFALVEAISSRRVSNALRRLNDFFDRGQPPLQLTALLHRQFRSLLMLAYLREARVVQSEWAHWMRLPPFVVRKLTGQAGHFTSTKLEMILDQLLELEWKLKSTSQSSHSLFTLFILGLMKI